MTMRLVALMSVVLLLSLGAFGLLLQHSQAEVLQEVARTASEVGRATLNTFDFVVAADPAASGHAISWQTAVAGDGPDGEPAGTARITHTRRIVLERTTPDGSPPVVVSCSATDDDPGACVGLDRLPAAVDGQMTVLMDEIRAESDPEAGMIVLKIPRLMTADRSDVWVWNGEDRAPGEPPPAAGAPAAAMAAAPPGHFEELELPIPTAEFDALFSAVRRRTIFLLLGVFAVGSVLSAGLAARFTRPIRRLDGALHRLSDGDLEVRVETHGRDEIARLGAAFNDMTRKLRANRERERQLVRREKLSALGRLAAGVAHDVRNPLHSISLTLDHLTETGRPEADERQREFDRAVEIIRGEVRRLDRLVGNFLRFARTDRRERSPIDLRDLLVETERLVAKEAEWRRVAVELDLADDVPSVTGDGEALRSSILNLVLNAFEAMPDGGRLGVRLRRDGDEAWVVVSDTGHGIPEEDRERVFDFAYTTREGGSGLGLAMVHQCVVEEHGGRVILDSGDGRGTSVTLVMPLRAARRGNAA